MLGDEGQIVDLHTMKAIEAARPRAEMREWQLEEPKAPKSQIRASNQSVQALSY